MQVTRFSAYFAQRDFRSPENGRGRHTNSLVLEARARIESQIEMLGPAGQGPSSSDNPGPDLLQLTAGGPSTLLDTARNPTWVTEHNFPAMLSRCKFPKKYDAVHQLQTNKSKKRMFAQMPVPPLPEGMAASITSPEMEEEIRKSMFTTELKNTNNRNR